MTSVDSPLFDVTTLEQMYCESCKKHGVLPNSAILSGFSQAQVQKSCNQMCSLFIFLDDVKDTDFPPLFDLCIAINTSEVQAVDIGNGSSCMLRGEHVLSLMHAVNQKLHVVVLRDSPMVEDILRELSQKGSTCQVLNLKSSPIRHLNMVGEFRRLRILNLDFSISLTSFPEDCFTCMPNLAFLTMCGTKIENLWRTVAALSKLPFLEELSFQKWVLYSASSTEKSDDETEFGQPNNLIEIEEQSFGMVAHENANLGAEESSLGESSAGSLMGDITDFASTYVACHASPICFEKHYREYTIASLPPLKVLDNLPIRKAERERAAVTFSEYFEYLPYNRKHTESIMNILYKRELKASQRTKSQKHVHSYGNSQHSYTRSFCAAKLGSSAWPFLHALSISRNDIGHANSSFRPRQFEYHPTIPSLMVFGTLDGDVVVVNHENEKIVGHIPSRRAMNSVLGLCWLKKYPSKHSHVLIMSIFPVDSHLIAGWYDGSLRLYDIENMPTIVTGMNPGSGSVAFDDFDQFTCVHANSTNELFLASGYSKDVALYDLNHGRRIQVFTDMHRWHINVVKFSNHMPSIFATSSFDHDVKLWDLRLRPIRPCHTSSSSRRNVMVCFSPDDQYLLASAVDNEVRQLLTVDGRLHLSFEIAPLGSPQNYTRSTYLKGGDYIITGSCDEHVVRVCCARTGRRLRDICLEGQGLGTSMHVRSLRGDPFMDFNLSILVSDMGRRIKSEIVKVNLLQS